MAYAQRDYNELQGIDTPGFPRKYRIAQVGCFLTAFTNIFNDMAGNRSPLDLNAAFRDSGIYIDVDDGIRDDLGWDSLPRFDSNVILTNYLSKGITDRSAGWPGEGTHAIVRFWYRSVSSGQMITHFSKAVRPGVIVDSWDGVEKANPYGEPTGWATYEYQTPPPTAPPAPEPVPVVEAPVAVPEPVPAPIVVTEPELPFETVPTEPGDPDAWQDTYVEAPGWYISLGTYQVTDFAGNRIGRELVKNDRINTAGYFFYRDGVKHARPVGAVAKGLYYNLPMDRLRPENMLDEPDDNVFDLRDLDMSDQPAVKETTLKQEAEDVVRNFNLRSLLLQLTAWATSFFRVKKIKKDRK